MPDSSSSSTSSTNPTLVLGILSAPSHHTRRTWIRQHVKWPPSLNVVQRFVLGNAQGMERGCLPSTAPSSSCRDSLSPGDEEEAAKFGDVLLLDVDDNPRVGHQWAKRSLGSFPSKSLAWFSFAARAYPRAAFIAKADDDSWVGVPATTALIRRLQNNNGAGGNPPPYIWAGWIQYASFLRSEDSPTICGWSPIPRDAARAAMDNRSNCYRRQNGEFKENATAQAVRGPYPFAAGPFELLSGELARHVFLSRWTSAFASGLSHHFTSRIQSHLAEDHKLAHGEDALIGHVVFEHAKRLNGVQLIGLNSPTAYRRPLVTNLDVVPTLSTSWVPTKRSQERLSGQALYNEVRRFVTIHKFEPDDDALRTTEGNEGIQDVTLLRRNITPIGHMRANAIMNRKIRPVLERIGASSGGGGDDALIELKCHHAHRKKFLEKQGAEPNGAQLAVPAVDGISEKRLNLLNTVSRINDEIGALTLLLPEWSFCTVQRVNDPPRAATTVATQQPPPAPLAYSPSVRVLAAGLVWRSLGNLSAVKEDKTKTAFTGGLGLSLNECKRLCESDASCQSIAFGPNSGHCTPLATVVNERSPTKCLPCGCECFVTHFLARP